MINRYLYMGCILLLGLNGMAVPRQGEASIHGAWQVHKIYNGKKLEACCVMGKPQKKAAVKGRRESFVLLHMPASQNAATLSIAMGYPLQKKKTVEVLMGSRKFHLHAPQGHDTAWPADVTEQGKMLASALNSSSMNVAGYPAGQTKPAQDTYRMEGFKEAFHKGMSLCGKNQPHKPGKLAAKKTGACHKKKCTLKRSVLRH